MANWSGRTYDITSPTTPPSFEEQDTTSVSRLNRKQLEDHVNTLRKENFHLNLKVYFLEEHLSNTAPSGSRGLLEQNIRLQVEVEDLKKEISDQRLEAQIDVLERQNKELVYAHASDSQLEKCDDHHRDWEDKVRELQKSVETGQDHDNTSNLQQLLAERLQGLAYFVDKLLSHKCVIGEEKIKLAESILEQSLAFRIGLQLDELNAPVELWMDESQLNISQNLRVEDLNMRLGHDHDISFSDDEKQLPGKPNKNYTQADITESECWSEPDRSVSFARVGPCDTGLAARESTTEDNRLRARRSRVLQVPCSKDNKLSNEAGIIMELDELTKDHKNDLNNELECAIAEINDLVSEKDTLEAALAEELANSAEKRKNFESMKKYVTVLELKGENVVQRLFEALQLTEKLRTNLSEVIQLEEKLRTARQELESTYMETERALRRAANETTVQASEAALERDRAQHDQLRIERELKESREKPASVMEINAQLQIEATRKMAAEANDTVVVVHQGFPPDEERPGSSDQGIDSDRPSSLEQNDGVYPSARALYEENVTLIHQLAKNEATLGKAVAQWNAEKLVKSNFRRAICREIHNSQDVLRKARDQMGNNKNE